MATKAPWTMSSRDTREQERPNSAGTRGTTHVQLPVASRAGSACGGENRQHVAHATQVHPSGLSDSTLGTTSQGYRTCSFPLAPKETITEFFTTKK